MRIVRVAGGGDAIGIASVDVKKLSGSTRTLIIACASRALTLASRVRPSTYRLISRL
jgi:hypothetical protein